MIKPRKLETKTLFFTTSPRTPTKMIPEIRLLKKFEGRKWDGQCQSDYANALRESEFFKGNGEKDPAFSARDRINRSPKSLGFVTLSPVIKITSAGEKFIEEKRTEDVLLKQLLKFQLPSAYHESKNENEEVFWVKPFLEIIRLIDYMESITFEELRIFGLQLTNYNKFDLIVNKIVKYREERSEAKNKKKFYQDVLKRELLEIYDEEIQQGNIKIRESKEISIKKFLDTKADNTRDYADACIRYLRDTGIIKLTNGVTSRFSIMPTRQNDVDFILQNVDRDPVYVDSPELYIEYLSNPQIPKIYSDDANNLIDYIMKVGSKRKSDLVGKTYEELLDIRDEVIAENRNSILSAQLEELQSYHSYQSIVDTFDQLKSSYDAPLFLEWNVWRSMAMLDDGNIKGNFKLDDEGSPMSTAGGNMPDIECIYRDFGLTVEVTMSAGSKQYEMEGESVSRHLGAFKQKVGKESYCLFIAEKINPAVIGHFFVLHKTNVSIYGGKSVIIPMELNVFRTMIENAYSSKVNGIQPTSNDIKKLFEDSREIASKSNDENEWYNQITDKARNWMKVNS